ncbi:MAG TPA: hypothetical protein VK509_25825, partial [Polyangiales bacterium]|nr:hypothetical protein [Polyangiales bacterium]
MAAACWLLLCHCASDDQGDDAPAPAGMTAAGSPAAAGSQAAAGSSGAGGMAPIGVAGAAGSAAPFDAGSAPSTPDARVPLDAGPSAPDAASDASTRDAADAPDSALVPDAGAPDDGAGGRGEDPPQTPVYRIPLRVHHGDSALDDATLLAVLDEMNWIWWSQAAVCFEIEIVDGEQTMQAGFDFWFHQGEIPCSPGANGVYCGDHDIHSLDRPSLGAVDNMEWDTEHNPSRTSAHELGHGLSLDHFNGFADSNDSLMSSGRQGFKLHEAEITAARNRARSKALADTAPLYCAAPALA